MKNQKHIPFSKILFVCNANLNRSPTFEKWYKQKHPHIEVKSCGIYFGYPHQLNKELLDWADNVYVMTLKMAKHIHDRYQKEHYDKVEVIGIEDEFSPDQTELIELIEFWDNQK